MMHPLVVPAPTQANLTSLRMSADANEFLDPLEVQTAHLQADTKLTSLQQSCIGKWPNSVLSMEKTKFTPQTTAQEKLDSFMNALKLPSPSHQRYNAVSWRPNFQPWNSEPRDQSTTSPFA